MRFGIVILAVACLASVKVGAQERMPPDFTCVRPDLPDCALESGPWKNDADLRKCEAELAPYFRANDTYRRCLWEYEDDVSLMVETRMYGLLSELTALEILNNCRMNARSEAEMDRCYIPDYMYR